MVCDIKGKLAKLLIMTFCFYSTNYLFYDWAAYLGSQTTIWLAGSKQAVVSSSIECRSWPVLLKYKKAE